MRIAVIGTGYLGSTHAACMASLGHEVIGVDDDESKLNSLRSGVVPFYEPSLDQLTQKLVGEGRLRFTSSYEEAAAFADAFFITVGTPQRSGSLAADTSAVDSVIERLVPLIERDAVILGKSTVPVGTAAGLRRRVRELATMGVSVELVWNPEFLREGHAIEDTLRPDRLVLGIAEGDVRGESVARQIYAQILEDGIPMLVMDLSTAELAKTAANSFLATKISFINAMAEMCEAAGADVVQLADAIGCDPRIGRSFLNAGLGFGGGCLPKDIRGLMARAGELGALKLMSFLSQVDSINLSCRTRMVDLVHETCGEIRDTRIAVLGAAFKPETDDVRDSPALHVAALLQNSGATVAVYDPEAAENSRRMFPRLDYCDSVEQACDAADLVLVLTEWKEFRDIDPFGLAHVVRQRRVIDGRNCLDSRSWRGAGWIYRAYGCSEEAV